MPAFRVRISADATIQAETIGEALEKMLTEFRCNPHAANLNVNIIAVEQPPKARPALQR